MAKIIENSIMHTSTLHPKALLEKNIGLASGVVIADTNTQEKAMVRSPITKGNLGWLPAGMGTIVDLQA
jgi:hypothetical protein